MTQKPPDAAAIAYEDGVNRRYLKMMLQRSPERTVTPRSGARPGIRHVMPNGASGSEDLIGRLDLDHVDRDFERSDFYIGPAYYSCDDMVVYSWASSVAGLFFLGTAAQHTLAASLKVRRTIIAARDEVVAVVDDWTGHPNGSAFTGAGSGALNVPAPPSSSACRRPKAEADTKAKAEAAAREQRNAAARARRAARKAAAEAERSAAAEAQAHEAARRAAEEMAAAVVAREEASHVARQAARAAAEQRAAQEAERQAAVARAELASRMAAEEAARRATAKAAARKIAAAEASRRLAAERAEQLARKEAAAEATRIAAEQRARQAAEEAELRSAEREAARRAANERAAALKARKAAQKALREAARLEAALQAAQADDETEDDASVQEEDGQAHEDHPWSQMRAAQAVLSCLQAPRQEKMSSILSTLQPDQYDLVSRSPDETLVVQGHPGTGKTVIAAYRAVFLVHPDRADGPLPRVLLLGPTQTFVRHVEDLVHGMDPNQHVTISGLEELLKRMAGISGEVFGPADGEAMDTAWAAGSLFALAVNRARQQEPSATQLTSLTPEKVWEMIRSNRVAGRTLTTDGSVQRWAAELPHYASAIKQRHYLPLMANLALCLRSVNANERFSHLIVDEAQDLRPLEWRAISFLNKKDQWTIVGDMNQRHSDRTYSSWSQLAADLDLVDDPDSFEPVIFERGYRSTDAILAFANRLLPRGERAVACLQTGGVAPAIRRVEPKQLAAETVGLAELFIGKHPAGTTAIITTTPFAVLGTLRAGGWRKEPRGRNLWALGERELFVATPEQARGLEFDAVVVQEPSDFPENYGRRGPLYTSLTRANRELGIVHSKSLPPALR